MTMEIDKAKLDLHLLMQNKKQKKTKKRAPRANENKNIIIKYRKDPSFKATQ